MEKMEFSGKQKAEAMQYQWTKRADVWKTEALALILLMSVLVLPAMAAPRYAIGPCNYCGGPTVFRGMTDTTPRYTKAECTVCGRLSYFVN